MGWIAPVIIRAKSIIQKLWKDKIDWDSPIDDNILKSWLEIKRELHLLSELNIPRWVNFDPNDTMEIHGFCDASKVGFAAAVYLKNKTKKSVHLLAAKAKVTPLKSDKNDDNVTIPRLGGAVLLAKLVRTILVAFEFDFERVCLWSDSKIVLSWIQADPNRYKSFIASKIRKINKCVEKNSWFHVPTEFNSADCVSRGLLPSELIKHTLWWHGPQFLRDESYDPVTVSNFSTDLEQELPKVTVSTVAVTELQLQGVVTFDELKRQTAMSMRNDDVAKANSGNLTTNELTAACEKIIRTLQNEHFKEEIVLLGKSKKLPKSNKYLSLSPFVDTNGILRVGGRLKDADLPYEMKHQILLPNKNAITDLIIKECHETSLHSEYI